MTLCFLQLPIGDLSRRFQPATLAADSCSFQPCARWQGRTESRTRNSSQPCCAPSNLSAKRVSHLEQHHQVVWCIAFSSVRKSSVPIATSRLALSVFLYCTRVTALRSHREMDDCLASTSLAFAAVSCNDRLCMLLNRTGEKRAGEQRGPDGSSPHFPSTFHPLGQKRGYLADLQQKINPRGLCLPTLEENALKFLIKTWPPLDFPANFTERLPQQWIWVWLPANYVNDPSSYVP